MRPEHRDALYRRLVDAINVVILAEIAAGHATQIEANYVLGHVCCACLSGLHQARPPLAEHLVGHLLELMQQNPEGSVQYQAFDQRMIERLMEDEEGLGRN